MSRSAYTVSEAVERVTCHDPTLKCIDLDDSELTELIDCLLAHPDVVTEVCLNFNQLTDETSIKLARYLAISSTIQYLELAYDQFSLATYLALAAALSINTSLRILYLCDNQIVNDNLINKSRVEAAFVDALILNPNRPVRSKWGLYSWKHDDFNRLKRTAEELGHPSMQASLAITVY